MKSVFYECQQASTTAIRQELSSNSMALDELVVREREAQIRLQTLGDENKIKERLLELTQKMLSEHNYSLSAIISLAMTHAVALLKSHAP
jgi:hypothetical protein